MDINAARAAEATEGGLDKLGDLLNWRDSKRFSERGIGNFFGARMAGHQTTIATCDRA